ncbi:MAG: DnaA ATPase domain-containing protein [Aureliella sp.]
MAQDVNQSEKEVAALVRSALVARISQERFELWMPADCEWCWTGADLVLRFPSEFACQIAKRMLNKDLQAALESVVGAGPQLRLEVRSASDASNADSSAASESAATSRGAAVGAARTNAEPAASRNRQPQPPGALSAGGKVRPTAAASGAEARSLSELTDSPTAKALASAAQRSSQASDASQERAAEGLSAHSEPSEEGRADVLQIKAFQRDERSESEAPARGKADYWSEFVPGVSSQMAWATINLIANEPGRVTPVLVHGPYGVGKTHLANALAQRLRTQRRQRRVLHITAEQFTNDFTEAFRGSGLPVLRRKYRDVDTLILDDLQFLIGKKATINELRHTLDNLLKAGRQIVFLADRSLAELEPLGSDFVARLRGGLVSSLLPLDEETRFQLLKRDLQSAGINISDDIVMQIAARAIGDGRLLKGIVKRLMATAYMNEGKLTWDQCWNAVYDLIQATQPIVRLGDIERVVCEVFGLEPNSLQSERKTRTVSQPRMLAMFLARKYTPAAYQEIGEFFGNRRHSTVISAEKTVGSWLEENAKLQLPRGSLAIRDAVRHVEANLHVG